MGGTESGSTDGREGKRTMLQSKREGYGRIFQSDMSCLTSLFPSSVVSLCPRLVPFSTHRRALPLWLRCQSKVCLSSRPLCPFCLSSSISVRLSVSLSSFLKCCFFKVSPNNSALELYFASLFKFTRTICVLWFRVLFRWQTEVPDFFFSLTFL